MDPLAAGDPAVIGGFRLNARLGFGGMGRVYLGFSPAGRAVAVKVVRPELAMDAGFRHRFHTEVEAARRVSGAYTAPVIAAGPDDDPPWLATVFVPGPSLADVVSAHGALPVAAAWKLAAGLVEAVQAVHSCGVVHRDLKPGNVLLATDGPRVIDFGIARALDGTSVTATRTVFGTVPFMSPEQAEGRDIGPASDVFSLGSVIVYAVTGAPPFGDGTPASVLYRIVHGRPSLAGVPSGLLEVVSACLVKEPAARPGLPALTEMIRSGSPGADLSATSFWPESLLAQIHTHKLALTTAPQEIIAATPSPGTTPATAQVTAGQTDTYPATEINSSQTLTSVPAQLTPPPQPPPSAAPTQLSGPRRRLGKPRAVKWGAAAAAVIVAAVAATLVATSGGGKAPNAGQTPGHGTAPNVGSAFTGAGYDAALTRVVNPSTHSGGTLTLAAAGLPDSFDPGNTYQAWVWDFSRLYATPLVTYRACPGSCGLQLVPGLATGLGQVSADGLTWTYHLKRGVRFEDGTSVTAQDVKYAVERGYDKSVLPSGTYYFQNLLTDTGYPGPYKDRAKNLMGLSSVTTPDAYTIQFHLQSPFPDFDHVMALPGTAPVPPGKDSGAQYQQHPLSTGPYKFQTFTANRLTLVPNPRWQPSYNPQAKQLLSKIVMNLNVGSAAVDQQLLSGATDLDVGGGGVQDATRARVFASTALKANADNPLTGTVQFAYLNTQVSPLDNVACRRAVEYAADKTAVQSAYGGPVRGGPIASTVLPPVLPGYQKSDQYEATTMPSGDLAAAKRELAACGHPSGFTTGVAYENDLPAEVAAAQALRTSLARAGIKVKLSGYPSSSYYSTNAGVPAFVHAHDLGIDLGVWTADWPDGYGFLDTLTDGETISSSYNANIEELNDPAVNRMFSQADSAPESAPARTAIWGQIDRQVMSDAAIMPGVYGAALLYRNPALTNVYIDARYGTYDYAVLGLR